MAKANLRHRIEELERQQMSAQPSHSAQFDEDALTIYAGMSYLDATMEPTYHDIESTAIYERGEALRDTFYGPIIPAHLDEHLKRYTRASGEFELAFGREPKAGDMLHYQHVAVMHSPEVCSRHFDKLIEAWQRRLPHLTCPLKFEEGRLFRRLRPDRRDEAAKWEEDVRIQPEDRWLRIPEVFESTDFDPDSEAVLTIPAIVFPCFLGWAAPSTGAGRRPMRTCGVQKPHHPSRHRHSLCMEGKDFASYWWKCLELATTTTPQWLEWKAISVVLLNNSYRARQFPHAAYLLCLCLLW